jgi:hypothetical protein
LLADSGPCINADQDADAPITTGGFTYSTLSAYASAFICRQRTYCVALAGSGSS